MKTSIICLLIFLAISSNAQEVKDPLPSINVNHDMIDNSSESFIKTWNSGSIDRKLDSAMNMNYFNFQIKCNY